MTESLATFQAAFFDAVLGVPGAAPPPAYAEQPGFAVYRNTVMSGCVDALGANYPGVFEIVGAARFRELARAFVRESPPCDGVLAGYGAGFAAWLARADADLAQASALAALDRCWTESHLAPDAPVLPAGDLAALAPARFAAARLVPHPAARWLTLAEAPAFALWRCLRERVPADPARAREGESALLTRPGGAVIWRAIDRAGAAFLTACADGHPVAAALDRVADAGLGVDIAAWLPDLMLARAFTRIESGANA